MPTGESTSSKAKLCVTCLKNKKTPGASRCRSCQDRVNARQKELRAARQAAGLCKCGRDKPRAGAVDCQRCLTEQCESRNVTFKKRRLAGLCLCGAARDDGYKSCSGCREANRNTNARIRTRVFNHYGMQCACCSEAIFEFLELDHIDGGGNDHLREINCSLYKWVIKHNFPPGFQTLCSNCNRAKFRYGECPHKRQRRQ